MAEKRLYRGAGTKARQLRSFEKRYGKRGAEVYGRVVGKVAREQAEKRGRKVERVKAHKSTTRLGAPERVRSHTATLVGSRYRPEGSYQTTVKGFFVPAHMTTTRSGKRVRVKGHRVKPHKTTVTVVGL
jgi:hypothetical protein